MTDLSKEIQSKAEIIAEIILRGNTAEIKKNKDGIIVLETARKMRK